MFPEVDAMTAGFSYDGARSSARLSRTGDARADHVAAFIERGLATFGGDCDQVPAPVAIAEGTAAEVRANPAVIEAYLGVRGARESTRAVG